MLILLLRVWSTCVCVSFKPPPGFFCLCVHVCVLSDDDEIPQELLLGKQQLSELGSESAKIKAMGITCRVSPGPSHTHSVGFS